ncbi:MULTISPECIES: LytTR family DNA-binding domain-containing protein [unclassified Massilia]|uniref:LytR/AlgR family response regulator transcription factor n=1 Tax=unclassified Massilia TaxID=2609279 RepID=UPI001B814B97|nr:MULTISPECIES: LytTR family DNA-binding domain-containing protein [unclassified Massilia]MBQ5940470.1 response regulator transcription factor [Massilia sp. AB1]MBQ5963615.1 response regulator transcription factor [Massilia sp. ZL223]
MQDAARTIRALIVDDEAPARANLKELLRRHADIELAGEYDQGKAAADAMRACRPDLVFLDVQMPGCDGFDVLEMLGANLPPAVIFVTAYDSYALKAFDAGALDYLLKPYSDERFDMALARAREKLTTNRKSDQRLVLKNAGQVLFLPIPDIDWIGAADYYASLHVGTQVHLMRRGLAELEADLDPALFCRIHRSTMINLDRLQAIELNADGEHEAVLKSGVRLRISRSYRKQLMQRMGVLQT